MAGLLTEKKPAQTNRVMGFLSDEYEKAKKAFGLIGGVNLRNDHAVKQLYQTGIPELFSGRIGGQTLEQGIQNRMQANSLRPALSPQQMVDAGLNIVGMAPLGMTVYHGSPHKFDKFDMSKIGTGEGAQAYGHGLYMAENPKTAKAYQTATSAKNEVQFTKKLDNKLFDLFDVPPADVRASAQQMMQQEAFSPGYLKQIADDSSYQGLVAKSIIDGGIVAKEGSLYKVDIPDEAVSRMLDWDKPLSQQAPEVRAVIDELTKTPPQSIQGAQRFDWISAMIDAAYMRPGVENQVGGQSLYNTIGGFLGQDAATDLLKSKGIPGIRYLDGGSRGAGTGTSNFVLFDDQLPRILERNGVPTGLQPWGPGEWGGTSGLSPGFQNPAPRNSADLLAGVYPWAVPLSAGLLGSMLLLPNDAEAQ